MKKFVIVLSLILIASVSTQAQEKWLTNQKEAIAVAEKQNKHILIFASDNFDSESLHTLESEFFKSEEFKAIQSNFIYLKLDLNLNDYNKRLASHYTGVKVFPALGLIDKKGNPIGQSLNVFTTESIQNFISFLKANIKL